MTETSSVMFGPYAVKVEEIDGKISGVRIQKEPLNKAKNPNNYSVHIERALAGYLQGDRAALDTLHITVDGTPFQQKVWAATKKIPYGETRTYTEIAKQIGHPKAVRAVGTALGKNPVCIVVPCHRVVPSSGGIGQYAYGTEMKQWLLDHEQKRG